MSCGFASSARPRSGGVDSPTARQPVVAVTRRYATTGLQLIVEMKGMVAKLTDADAGWKHIRLRFIALSLLAAGAALLLPGCEEPGPPRTGSIRVTSAPPGARIFLDQSDTGRVTPYTIPEASVGFHTIRVTLDGHSDWGPQSVSVTAGQTATVDATLERTTPSPEPVAPVQRGLGLRRQNVQAYQSAYILRADPVISLPSSVDLSLDVPLPRSQGYQGSCVGWAVAFTLKSYHERIERGWPLTNDSHLMSPAYVYNQIKVPGGGAYFFDAFNLLLDQGVSSWAQMPYHPSDDRTQPSAAARAEAANYRIADWGTVIPGYSRSSPKVG